VEVAKKKLGESKKEETQLLTPEACRLIAELCIKYIHVIERKNEETED
jgi:hypothetical protein